MHIITYSSSNAPDHARWIAKISSRAPDEMTWRDLWPIVFSGSSEAEAVEKAEAYLAEVEATRVKKAARTAKATAARMAQRQEAV